MSNKKDKNAWRTPPEIFTVLNREFDFDLDAAADEDNALASTYLTRDDDAIKKDWSEIFTDKRGFAYAQFCPEKVKTVWITPPYGRGYIKKFMDKCVEQKAKGITSVLLVPCTPDALWLPVDDVSEIRFITGGRLSFLQSNTGKKVNGNTKGSMIVIFRPNGGQLKMKLVDRGSFSGANTHNIENN